jgi:hypothetical protein
MGIKLRNFFSKTVFFTVIISVAIAVIVYFYLPLQSPDNKIEKKYSKEFYQEIINYKKYIGKNNELDKEALEIVTALRRKGFMHKDTMGMNPYLELFEKIKTIGIEKKEIKASSLGRLEKAYLGEAVLDWNIHKIKCAKGNEESNEIINKKKNQLKIIQLNIKIEKKIKELENLGINLRKDPEARYRVVYRNAKENYRSLVERLYRANKPERWVLYIKANPDPGIYKKSSDKGPNYFIEGIKAGDISFEDKAFLVKQMLKQMTKEIVDEYKLKSKEDIEMFINKLNIKDFKDISKSNLITFGMIKGIIMDLEDLIEKLEKFRNVIPENGKIGVTIS